MKTRVNIPEKVKEIMKCLEDKGFGVFVVGGCVRDSLLGNVPNDWDMCTNGSPDEIINALSDKYTVIPTGLKHGTVSVVLDKEIFEITTYRKEEGYSDSRHPDKVTFVPDLCEDLKRRDFTINAMAYNDGTGLVDIYGGVDDLEGGIIRCVGNPEERFTEDALRILRGIRFSSRFGFGIEEDTRNAMIELKDRLQFISVERIFEELKSIFLSDNAFSAIAGYKPVFEVVLGRSIDIDRIVCIERLPRRIELRLGALLLQFGDDAGVILGALKSDTKTKKAVKCLIDNLQEDIPHDKITLKHLMNRFGAEMVRDLIIFSKEVNNIYEEHSLSAISVLDDIVVHNECYCLSQLEVSGTDLTDKGYLGRDIKDKLEEILEMVIEERVENKRDALLALL